MQVETTKHFYFPYYIYISIMQDHILARRNYIHFNLCVSIIYNIIDFYSGFRTNPNLFNVTKVETKITLSTKIEVYLIIMHS